MRQLILAFVSAFVLATAFVATAAADSHPPTGGTTVTSVPQTGAGSIAVSATDGVILLLIALAALMAFASMREWHRA